MNKPSPIMQDPLNDSPEPHQRQSIKGLFTFYREQQEMELKVLQSRSLDKLKINPKRIKSSVKISPENQSREIRAQKGLKKKKSKKDASLEETLLKSKKKKKSKKSAKQLKCLPSYIIEEVSKTVPMMKDEEQDPAIRFLKKIKEQKITKSPGLIHPNNPEPQKVEVNVEDEKYKFNRLFYPKESQFSQNVVDNLYESIDKIEPVNRFVRFNENIKKSKQEQSTQQMFYRKSSSEFKKSANSRKRNYTELDVSGVDHALLRNNVKQNFYSHKKLQEIVRLAHQVGNRQETQPISPPSEIKKTSLKNRSIKTESQEQVSESIKLPEIKNTRLSKQLKRVEELVAEQLQRYGSNKTKKSAQKLNKSRTRELVGKNFIEYSKKEKAALKKKLQTEPQPYCVALIDLSKSTSREPELNNINTSWSSKKKLLFKKLGINL